MSYSSTKKDPVSMKLRVANMKSGDVKNRTKQLEEESKQMEDRLRELKLTMNREKELRDQRGGGHWKSGKEGGLNTHAKDVLSKPPSKPKPGGSGKARKVKVLKDEPIATSPKTKEKPRPGTLAFLAQRDNAKPGLRPTGPICGQCEIKAAAVTCQECSEIYCSGCFTAFHLKGALAKHHSMPISKIASTPRTPRADNVSSQPPANKPRHPPTQPTKKIVWEQYESSGHEEDRDAATPPNNSLLDGEYDEKEAAQSFQQALAEWRKENTDPEPKSAALSSTRSSKQPVIKKPTQLKANTANVPVVSPVHTPRVNIDEGTSTVDGSTKPTTNYQPEFTNSELSYAEKLLLRKNRRSAVPSLSSGFSGSTGSPSFATNGEHDDQFNPDEDPLDEPVMFEDILALAQQSPSTDQLERSSTSRIIVEIEEVIDDESQIPGEDESHYVVSEEPQLHQTPVARVNPTVLPAPTAFFSKTSLPQFSTDLGGRCSVSSSLQIVEVTDSVDRIDIVSSPDHKQDLFEESQPSASKHTPPKGTTRPQSRQSSKLAGGSQRSVSRGQRPGSALSRPGSALGRSASRNNTSFHRANRPRTAAEKASEVFGDGTLTKRPSSALTDLIAKYKNSSMEKYTSPSHVDDLGSFFTAGVKPEFTERTLTPRKEKPLPPGAPLKKHQLSNKIYSLSSKSWRPNSSLGENVLDEEVMKFHEEFDASQLAFPLPQGNSVPLETTVNSSWSASRGGNNSNSVTDSITESLRQRLSFPAPHTSEHAPSGSKNSLSLATSSTLTRSKTEYSVKNRQLATPRRSKTPHSLRSHTPIVVDGDDMTRYDNIVLPSTLMDDDDLHTMDDLELELASQTGRLTADGRVSKLLLDEEDIMVDDTEVPKRSLTPVTHRSIDRLRESIMDDFEETELLIMQDEAMRVSLL